MNDPSLLLVTITQISATLCAILGGFLLTYGLARVAEWKRLTQRQATVRAMHATVKKEMADEDEQPAPEHLAAEQRQAVHLRFLRGTLSREGLAHELAHLDDEEQEQREHRSVRHKRWDQILDEASTEINALEETLNEQKRQMHLLVRGAGVLIVLAFFGIVVPISILMPGRQPISVGIAKAVVQVFLLVLIAVMLYMIEIIILGESQDIRKRTRRGWVRSAVRWLAVVLIVVTLPGFGVTGAVGLLLFLVSIVLDPEPWPKSWRQRLWWVRR